MGIPENLSPDTSFFRDIHNSIVTKKKVSGERFSGTPVRVPCDEEAEELHAITRAWLRQVLAGSGWLANVTKKSDLSRGNTVSRRTRWTSMWTGREFSR
eukprot:7098687-Pyramimonas_sp.AAC.1